MYTISKVLEDIILTCKNCNHTERVSQFNLSLGSQRTQAAQAMQAHSVHEHDTGPLLELLPNKYEVLASAAVGMRGFSTGSGVKLISRNPLKRSGLPFD